MAAADLPSLEPAPLAVLVGPESTGKTTLAASLAAHYACPLVAEYAREYLDEARARGRMGYREADLERIARTQWSRETVARARGMAIADTDLLVMAIWWRERYRRVPRWIATRLKRHERRLYLLCRPDLEWQADPLRESPDELDYLFDRYQAKLERLGATFRIVDGTGVARFETALDALDSWLNASQSR